MNQAALTPRPAASMSRQGRISSGMQLVCWVAVLSVIVLLRDLFDVNFPDIVISGLCALGFLFLNIGSGLGLYIFTSALTLPHNEIRIFYLVISCLKLIHSGKLTLHSGMLLLSVGTLVLQLLDMTLFSQLGVTSLIYDYVVRMLLLVLPLLWYSINISARQYRHALFCYAWGTLLGATVVLILSAQKYGLLNLMTGSGAYTRLGLTGTTAEDMQTSYNANQLGIMSALVIAIFLVMVNQKQSPKFITFPVIGYALVIILLTRSRTALLLCVGIAMVFYWVIIIQHKQIFRGLTLFIALLLVLLLVISLFPGIVDATLNRFIDQDDITNGRSDLLQFYIKEWVSNPWCIIFGYGIGSYRDAIPHATISPHNSISDVLICWGLTGIILIAGILWLCYRRNRRYLPRRLLLLAYLPAIVSLVSTLGGQYLTTGFPHMRTCFLLLAAKGYADTYQKGTSK